MYKSNLVGSIIISIGTVKLKVPGIYIPNLKNKCIISVKQLTGIYGGSIAFSNDEVHWHNFRGGQLLRFDLKKSNLYELEVADSGRIPEIYSTEVEDIRQKLHKRHGHLNIRDICTLYNLSYKPIRCTICDQAKMTRQYHPPGTNKASRVLGRVHTDLIGPIQEAFDNSRYIFIAIDEYSKFMCVKALQNKSDARNALRDAISAMEARSGQEANIVRSDKGKEYTNNDNARGLKFFRIFHETTVGYSSHQNGVAERYNRFLLENTIANLMQSGMSEKYWPLAINYVAFTWNVTHAKLVEEYDDETNQKRSVEKTAYEIMTGYKYDIDRLKPFGCYAVYLDPTNKKTDLSPRGKLGIHVGYPNDQKGYIILQHNGDIKTYNDIKFRENEYPRVSNVQLSKGAYREYSVCHNINDVIPNTYYEAMRSEEARDWKQAIDNELESLWTHEVVEEVPKPEGRKLITSRWVFAKKYNPDNTVDKYKARLVARGFTQREGIDYKITFAPVISHVTIRLALALAAKRRMKVHQIDVATAFLNAELEEEVYMVPPQGITVSPNHVWLLKKGLYGLKQAPRQWYKTLCQHLTHIGFQPIWGEECMYVKTIEKMLIILVVYVDDILICCKSEDIIEQVKRDIANKFKISDKGISTYMLGWEIRQNQKGIFINQEKYINDLLQEFDIQETSNTPYLLSMNGTPDVYKTGLTRKTSKETSNPTPVQGLNEHDTKRYMANKKKAALALPYTKIVGKLHYLISGTRPDITKAVSEVASNQKEPKEEDYLKLYRILTYLNKTKTLGIMYSADVGEVIPTVYTDANYISGGDIRSTTGCVVMCSNGPIYWTSKKQSITVNSTVMAEYVALNMCLDMVHFIRNILTQVINLKEPIVIYEDNLPCIQVCQQEANAAQSRHVLVKYRVVREAILRKSITLTHIKTSEQKADGFTKALAQNKFNEFIGQLHLQRSH